MTMKYLSAEELETYLTVDGQNLYDLSRDKPVLLVFLRHFGCVFCREAMKEIASRRKSIENEGNLIVLVHMSSPTVASSYFKKFGLEGISQISDPDCRLYAGFGLAKGSFSQLFGLKTMVRGFSAGINMGQFGGVPFGDAFQMPGMFMIHQGKVEGAFVHETISDRPDFEALLDCCNT